MFETNPESLSDLLASAQKGRLQLPDFQRSYVWDDGAVRSLIASVARGFPVGALLTLESGGEVRFAPRPVEGANAEEAPLYLLLDGQQRITSLFQSLWSPEPVRTRNAKGVTVERHYYLDMAVAASGRDMEDAIVSVPADRVIRTNFARDVVSDLSTREGEVREAMFPLDRTFNAEDWWDDWNDGRPREDRPLRDAAKGILAEIRGYRMPVIRLTRGTSRQAVCTIFEKVNMGGVKLDAFELVTAMFAAEGFDLRADWTRRRGALVGLDDLRRSVLIGAAPKQAIEPTEFLQVVSFLRTRDLRRNAEAAGKEGRQLPAVSIQRPSLLTLKREDYERFAESVEEGFAKGAGFLNARHVASARDLPYAPMRVALACLYAARSGRPLGAAESDRVAEWFWAVALGEQYGSSTETRIARDVTEILEWLEGGAAARSIGEATFYEDRLDSLTTRNAAAYKAIHALLMEQGCRDFVSGERVDVMTVQNSQMDIHHIFPRAWCDGAGFDSREVDAIVNKTALSARSNRSIGGRAPADYLRRIEDREGIGPSALDDILRTHLIEPATLRANDFVEFYAARREAMKKMIASVLRHGVRSGDEEPEAKEAA